MTTPPTYGAVDPLANTVRYADIAVVKRRLNINTSTRDDEIERAIIAGEIAMDYVMGRSFPDTGDNPQIAGIPIGIKQAAENLGVAIWKATDAPFGSVNSPDFLGGFDISEMARRELVANPLTWQFVVSWGIA